MSLKYKQYICSEGHYFARYPGDMEECPTCGAKGIIWENEVDCRYGDLYRIILQEDLELFKMSPTIWAPGDSICSGNAESHIVSSARYRAPSPEETKKMRKFKDLETGEFVSLED